MKPEARYAAMPALLSAMSGGKHVRMMLFLLKYKHDEMPTRCRSKVAGQFETASTKLVQCQLYWTALCKVDDDKFV